MIPNAIAAFVGCFSALLVLAEITGNKLVRYAAAFVVGILVTVLLSSLVHWIAGLMGRTGY